MKITVVGAGAMGGSYGGHLARSGHEVTLVDTWQDHVDAINRDGLRLAGVLGDHRVRLPARTAAEGGGADLAIVFVDANNTAKAAQSLAGLLAPDGFAVTFQNGIGNVETLQAALGAERVLGGSSMCSAAGARPGPRGADPHGHHLGGRDHGTARARGPMRWSRRCAAPVSRPSRSPT